MKKYRQVTTQEQAQKLLALGVPADTASLGYIQIGDAVTPVRIREEESFEEFGKRMAESGTPVVAPCWQPIDILDTFPELYYDECSEVVSGEMDEEDNREWLDTALHITRDTTDGTWYCEVGCGWLGHTIASGSSTTLADAVTEMLEDLAGKIDLHTLTWV